MKRIFLALILCLFSVACGDNAPPEILDVTRLQNTASTTGPYGVHATVVDDKVVKIVELRYQVDDADWVIVPMENPSGNVYYGEIPGQSTGSRIFYFVVASDGEQAPEEIPQFPDEDDGRFFFDIIDAISTDWSPHPPNLWAQR